MIDLASWPWLAWSSFRRLLGVTLSHRGPLVVGLTLLAGDLFWIGYLGLAEVREHFFDDSRLNDAKALLITTDGGVPEWFGYAQALILVILLGRMFRSTKESIYLALALVFVVVLLDDALEIHESGGQYFAHLLHLRPWHGLRGRDIGELLTWSLMGALVVPPLAFTLARSNAHHRGNGLALLAAFGALLFCAVFVDLFYFYVDARSSFWPRLLFILAEDGGEMLALTLACMLALGAEHEQKAARS